MKGNSQEKKEKNIFSGMIITFLIFYFAVLVLVFVKVFAYVGAELSLDNISMFIAFALALPCILLSFCIYLGSSKSSVCLSQKKLIAVVIALFLNFTINIVIEEISLYLIPTTFSALILVQLVDKRDVFISNLMLNMVMMVTTFFESIMCNIEYAAMESIFMLLISVLTGAVISYSLSGLTSRTSFIIRSMIIISINIELMYLINLVSDVFFFFDFVGFLCLSNYGQVLLAILLEPIFESVFRILTSTKLHELSSSDLIYRLQHEAPGTYNHCQTVAGLAEACAIAIGESGIMARTCALYHDVGKLYSPMYFAENQSEGVNPHDNLLPEVSADILRKHTTHGYELCREAGIPEEIARVTIEHHGTLQMRMFYNKAKMLTDSDVDEYDYTYNTGSKPTTKIAAIIMICDACEAALRSMSDPQPDDVRKMLAGIINERVLTHQFDECDVTMQDINNIIEEIVKAFGGVTHTRMKYPKADKKW